MSCAVRASPSGEDASSRSVTRRSVCGNRKKLLHKGIALRAISCASGVATAFCSVTRRSVYSTTSLRYLAYRDMCQALPQSMAPAVSLLPPHGIKHMPIEWASRRMSLDTRNRSLALLLPGIDKPAVYLQAAARPGAPGGAPTAAVSGRPPRLRAAPVPQSAPSCEHIERQPSISHSI